jgi:hypothetical protein
MTLRKVGLIRMIIHSRERLYSLSGSSWVNINVLKGIEPHGVTTPVLPFLCTSVHPGKIGTVSERLISVLHQSKT